jgi:hypothetical protein
MNKITTAEEFWLSKTGNTPNQEEFIAMIEFAKLHLEAQAKIILEKVKIEYVYSGTDEFGDCVYTEQIEENSILNAYPLDNIK